MRLSTRSTYALRALIELALHAGRGPLSATCLAERQALSLAYLEQLLHRLKKGNIVRSLRGPKGGYELARQAHEITVDQIVHLLDGAKLADAHSALQAVLGDLSAQDQTLSSQAADQIHAACVTQVVWRCVHQRLMESLSQITLQNLAEEVLQSSEAPLDHRYVFHI